MDKLKKLWKNLKKKDENIKLLKWMINITKPYYRFIIYVFLISVVSMLMSYGSMIIGKYVVDDAVTGVLSVRNVGIMCAATCVSIIIGIFSSIISSYIGEKFSFSIRQKLYDDIQRSLWYPISKYHRGDLVTRLTSDIAGLSDGLISLIPSTILVLFQLLVSFFILFYYDRQIALFALTLGPISASFMLFFRKKYKKYQIMFRESESEYRSFMQESLSDLAVLKSFRQEDNNYDRMERLKNERLKLVVKSTRLGSIMSAVMRLVYSAGYVVAFCWGAYRISTGEITYGTLTVFISLVSRVQGSVGSLAGVFPRIYSMLISAKRVCDVTETEKERRLGLVEIPDKVGIVFDGVTFAYENDTVLNDISFAVSPGEKIGIVGTSGIGKTTVIRLMLSLISPNSGSVRYTVGPDAVENACPDSRRFIAYVPQGNTLRSGTVADNLRMGKSDADENEMMLALRQAAADSFIGKLPKGLDSTLQEKAGGISEGQAQRIAIARALIGRKPVLILDEATSSLDENTETQILENISRDLKDTTCIIITHRRSMLRYCDRVLEFDDGGGMRASDNAAELSAEA